MGWEVHWICSSHGSCVEGPPSPTAIPVSLLALIRHGEGRAYFFVGGHTPPIEPNTLEGGNHSTLLDGYVGLQSLQSPHFNLTVLMAVVMGTIREVTFLIWTSL